MVGLGGLPLNGAAGFLVDHTRRPRLQLALACVAILAGTLLLLPALGVPALAAVGLACWLGETRELGTAYPPRG